MTEIGSVCYAWFNSAIYYEKDRELSNEGAMNPAELQYVFVDGLDGRFRVTWAYALLDAVFGLLEMDESTIFVREMIDSLFGACVGVISNLRKFFWPSLIGDPIFLLTD